MPWVNAVTGLGENAASTSPVYMGQAPLQRAELDYLVRFCGPAATIVRRPALDATREGWRLLPDLDEDLSRQLRRECERIGLQQLAEKALLLERWYGGAALIVDTLDEQDTHTPLQIGRGIRGFTVASRHELARMLTSEGWIYQYVPEAPLMWRVSARMYHPSRIHLLTGAPLPDLISSQLDGWGDPILQAVYEALAHSGQGSASVLEYLQRLSVPFLRMAGWAKLVASDGGAAKASALLKEFKQRFTAFRLGVLDAGDEINQFSATVSGIADLLEHQRADVACAAQMPQTVIYGRSPAGQNATGQSDLELYYGWVAATIQRPRLLPLLTWAIRLILRSPCWQQGEQSNPLIASLDLDTTDLQITFPPLWMPSASEEQTRRSARASELATYAGMGWIDTDEGRQILRRDGILPDEEEKLEEDLGIASPFLTPADVRKAAAIGYQLWRSQPITDRISAWVPSINAALRNGEELTPKAAADLDAWFSLHAGPYAEGSAEYVDEMLRGGTPGRLWASRLMSGMPPEEVTATDASEGQRVTWQGMELMIEVPAGGVRIFDEGMRVYYPYAYGYVIDSVGLDGEPTDVLIYDLSGERIHAGIIYKDGPAPGSVRQVDEIKLVLGAPDQYIAQSAMTLTWGHRCAESVTEIPLADRWIVLGKEGAKRRDAWLKNR